MKKKVQAKVKGLTFLSILPRIAAIHLCFFRQTLLYINSLHSTQKTDSMVNTDDNIMSFAKKKLEFKKDSGIHKNGEHWRFPV